MRLEERKTKRKPKTQHKKRIKNTRKNQLRKRIKKTQKGGFVSLVSSTEGGAMPNIPGINPGNQYSISPVGVPSGLPNPPAISGGVNNGNNRPYFYDYTNLYNHKYDTYINLIAVRTIYFGLFFLFTAAIPPNLRGFSLP